MSQRIRRRSAFHPCFVCLLLFLTLYGSLITTHAQEAFLSEKTREDISALVKARMEKDNIPGISIAVVTNRKLQWTTGFGYADLENSLPATAQTVFRLASISKTITAVAAMQLYERNRLELDAPVQKYVPEFPEKPWPVTTRQLLGHLGGIRHYKNNEINSTRYYPTLKSALDIFKNDPLVHEPETKYTYTTYGYTLLGCILETASGTNFTTYVRDNIFLPAGMVTTRVDETAALIPHRAAGYRKNGSGELQNSGLADTSYKIPGGGFCARAEDLASFAIALMENRLLKPETTQLMFTPLKTRDGKTTNYGLGWNVQGANGKKVVSHSGGQQRVSTFLYIEPETGIAVVVLANLEGANSAAIARDIAGILSKK